jgi:predicted phage tail component-like protein
MYNFIDVNEASESAVLPSEALKINGKYIEDQISGYRTLTVSGREALSPDVVTYTTGVRDGSRVKNKRFPERIITVTYQLRAESSTAFREAYNQLASILNVEDAELIFNDEQDKFLIGTPCIIGSVKPGANDVVGEFEILCADPFKYSVIEYEAYPTLDEKSVLIDYNGTYKAFPVLQADFYKEKEASEDGESVTALTGAGDCGYVAFFTEDEKIIQIGDPEEVDGEDGAYPKSQTLVSSVFGDSKSWGSAAKSQWTLNNGVVSSHSFNQVGNVAMKVATYKASQTPATTSGTLLSATSKEDSPNIKYTVTAKASNRTAHSVKVTISIKAALTSANSYWYNDGVLINSVYINGAWHNVTMKTASDNWKSTSGHIKNLTVTVTGLTESTTTITGIKFKASRSDTLGRTGILSETACKTLTISKYVADTPDGYYLAPSAYGTGVEWHGPSITRTIPADAAGDVGATNFTLSYLHKMCIGSDNNATNQYGAFQILLSDANGNVVCGVTVYKGSSGKKAKLRFYVNNATATTMDVDLSYNNRNFDAYVSNQIRKSGQQVEFNVGGVKRTYRDANLANVAATKITITMAQHSTKPLLEHNGLFYVSFCKHHCDTWKDVPNKFGANDVVEADCKNGEIYLNGAPTPSLGALGNDWEDFVLTPGLNQIGFSYSSWTADEYAPVVKVRYREVFL